MTIWIVQEFLLSHASSCKNARDGVAKMGEMLIHLDVDQAVQLEKEAVFVT
jgi:hypothetical protein